MVPLLARASVRHTRPSSPDTFTLGCLRPGFTPQKGYRQQLTANASRRANAAQHNPRNPVSRADRKQSGLGRPGLPDTFGHRLPFADQRGRHHCYGQHFVWPHDAGDACPAGPQRRILRPLRHCRDDHRMDGTAAGGTVYPLVGRSTDRHGFDQHSLHHRFRYPADRPNAGTRWLIITGQVGCNVEPSFAGERSTYLCPHTI